MAERDEVDPGDPVERWVLIGHSMHQHYRVRVETVPGRFQKNDLHTAACGYSYQKGFEVIPNGDWDLPWCPRCLAVMAETARAAGAQPSGPPAADKPTSLGTGARRSGRR